jgi:hypothetical protein
MVLDLGQASHNSQVQVTTGHDSQVTTHNDSRLLWSLDFGMCIKCNIENQNGLNVNLQKSQ